MSILRVLSFIVLGMLGGAASAGDLVVIQSSVENLAPGAIVAGTARLTLPAGAFVTFVSSRGNTIRLEGPYDGVPDPSVQGSDSGLLESLSRLVKGDSNQAVLAVFRSGPNAEPDGWSMNVGRPGSYCVRSDRPATLWRKLSGAPDRLTIEGSQGGRAVEVAWPAGEPTIRWPTELPVVVGPTYRARLQSDGVEIRFTLLEIPKALPTDAHRAAWMGENGCERQARRVLERLVLDGN